MSRNLQPLSNRLSALPGSSLAHVKTQSAARDEEEKSRRNRLKGVIVLMEQFLADQGYVHSLQSLQQESQVGLSDYCVADNIDLVSAINEYENFYQLRFQRKPKLFRLRSGDGDDVRVVNDGGEKMLTRKSKPAPVSSPTEAPAQSSSTAKASPTMGPKGRQPLANRQRDAAKPADGELNLNVEGTKVVVGDSTEAPDESSDTFTTRAMKPLPVFPTGELTELAGTIMREILDVNPSIRWNDIAELYQAKQLLKEAVVMPVKYPELFEGIVRPWKGILLFGPPGTGKTMLAKAVATECNTTFFNISASSVVSKWRGDSEKLVRMLFDIAVHYAPSTIFIDEIDSLMSARSSEGEHEGSRRMKTELLTQMDGLSRRRGGDIVFVLAASNVPWDLDSAMLRRLEKRIYVTLPTPSSRMVMFQKMLSSHVEDPSTFDWESCAAMTDMMSGADIDILCREAMMRPIRKLIEKLEEKRSDSETLSRESLKPIVGFADVEASASCTRSSVGAGDLKKFEKWHHDFGSGISQ